MNQKTVICVDHYGHEHEVPLELFQFRISVYGALKEKGKVLFVQERWGKKWELPGGGVRPDELVPEALEREFTEETGLVIKPGPLISIQEDFFYAEDRDEAFHSIRLIYTVKKISGSVRTGGNGDDIDNVKFFSRKELNSAENKPGVFKLIGQIY